MEDQRENMEQAQEKSKKKIFTGKFTRENFLVILLAGILLLVIAWPTENGSGDENTQIQSGQWDSERDIISTQSDKTQKAAAVTGQDGDGGRAYAAYLETSLEELLSTMEGVGEVKVMITLKDSGEAVVEKDKTTSRRSSTEVDSAGGSRNTLDISEEESSIYADNEIPYITRTLTPSIEGIVVSAQGGGNAGTVRNITEAIQALFGIDVHKIKVVKMISH